MAKISVVINTLNDEKNLPRVLSSVKKLADEIVICDMESDDGTVEIARKFKAKVFSHKKEEYVELVRNFSLSKATGDWILVLDPDEEVPESLGTALKEIAERGDVDYAQLPRKNIIFGKWLEYSRWWPDYIIRFFRKGMVEWSDVIHLPPQAKGEGIILEKKPENAINHYHYETIDQFILRLNRYTTAQAKTLVDSGYSFNWVDLLKKPAGEFFSRYFSGQGYKDGLHGLALSLLQSFSELVLYLKVWQMQGFSEDGLKVKEVVSEIRKIELEMHYWSADALINEGGGVIQRVKRKLRF